MRSDLETLLMPVLQQLYSATKARANHLYMLQVRTLCVCNGVAGVCFVCVCVCVLGGEAHKVWVMGRGQAHCWGLVGKGRQHGEKLPSFGLVSC